jgi:hypothetical protein
MLPAAVIPKNIVFTKLKNSVALQPVNWSIIAPVASNCSPLINRPRHISRLLVIPFDPVLRNIRAGTRNPLFLGR